MNLENYVFIKLTNLMRNKTIQDPHFEIFHFL